MGAVAKIAIQILMAIPWSKLPWNIIIPLLFDLFSSIFGKGLMKFAYELVGEREKEKAAKEPPVDGARAERINVRILETVTRQSPGLAATWCKAINLIAYGKWTLDNAPDRWSRWVSGLDGWSKGAPRIKYESTDYMKLYKGKM